MAAVDSLVGLIDLRKAEGLVLEADRVPLRSAEFPTGFMILQWSFVACAEKT